MSFSGCISTQGKLSFAYLFPQELGSYRTKITDEIDDDESEWEVDDEAE